MEILQKVYHWVSSQLSLALGQREGQGLVEYALILLFVAIAVVATLTVFGTTLSGTYATITGMFP